GLNKNAGFFVKNFYSVMLRPGANDKEQLFVSRVVTLLMGLLVILAALLFSTWKDITLFNLMLQFGALIAVPYSMPLIWGTLVKRAPAWSGWTTMLVGFATSLAGRQIFTVAWLEKVAGWTDLTPREQDDWVLLVGVL